MGKPIEYEEKKYFINRMLERLELGRQKYGDDYEEKNIDREMEDELIDIANYALMKVVKMKRRQEDGLRRQNSRVGSK
jgi:hypothetical protein